MTRHCTEADVPSIRTMRTGDRALSRTGGSTDDAALHRGRRAFDPHNEHWYSNLVADWRFNR
jgi:hypothetical protein